MPESLIVQLIKNPPSAGFLLSKETHAHHSAATAADPPETERTDLANANSAQILAEQGKRLALEQWLAASDQSHYRALTDEKTKQARLRDRLATADLRLSVLLDTTATNGSDGMQATTGPGCVVHGTARAQLDRAHAQRIIGITNNGDQGLIALEACQMYAKGISGTN